MLADLQVSSPRTPRRQSCQLIPPRVGPGCLSSATRTDISLPSDLPPVTVEDFKLLGIDLLKLISSNLADLQSRGSEDLALLSGTQRILGVLDNVCLRGAGPSSDPQTHTGKLVRSSTVNSDIRVGTFDVLSRLCLPHGITPDACTFSDKTCFKIDLAYISNNVTDPQMGGTRGQTGDLVYVKLLRLHSRSQAKLAVIKQVSTVTLQVTGGRSSSLEVLSRISEVDADFTPELGSRP